MFHLAYRYQDLLPAGHPSRSYLILTDNFHFPVPLVMVSPGTLFTDILGNIRALWFFSDHEYGVME